MVFLVLATDSELHVLALNYIFFRRVNDQRPVARSPVSANHWFKRGIKTYRFPWHLTLVSANHASSNPGQTVTQGLDWTKPIFDRTLSIDQPLFLSPDCRCTFCLQCDTELYCHRRGLVSNQLLVKQFWLFHKPVTITFYKFWGGEGDGCSNGI